MAGIVGGLLVLLLLWIGLAIGCGYWARSILAGKGRSGTAGFWLGFCLGITGVLIAALLSATPEHEARKMQMQMQMMGMPGVVAPPPASGSAAPLPGFGAVPPAGWPTAARSPRSLLPSVIIALVVSVLYLLGWLKGTYAFEYAFGSSTGVSFLVYAAGVAVAVVALVKKSPTISGLAVGVALGLCGLGFVAVANLLADWGGDDILFAALPFDIAAIVGAGLLWSRAASNPAPAAVGWWQQAAFGLAGAGVLLTLVASRTDLLPLVVSNLSIWGGFVIAGLLVAKAARTTLAAAIGWSATIVVWVIGTEFQGLSWQASKLENGLVMLAAAGLLGLAGWGLSATSGAAAGGDEATAVPLPSTTSTIAAPPPPPPPPPPAVSAFAPMPAAAFDRPAPPAPVHAWSEPSVAVAVESTVPRQLPVEPPAVRLRFGTGELVTLAGPLVVGRVPTVPVGWPGSSTLAVSDPSFTISSTHCAFSVVDEVVWVEDLGSTNGTDLVLPTGELRSLRSQRAELLRGGRIQLGDNWCQLDD